MGRTAGRNAQQQRPCHRSRYRRFRCKGNRTDAIGQLTELQVLNLGSHDEKIGANIFNNYDANSLTAAKKSSMRHDYENKFLKYDPRANMSDMIVESYNSDPKVAPKNRIKKDSRINFEGCANRYIDQQDYRCI